MFSFKKAKFLLIFLICLFFLISFSRVAFAQDSILPPCVSTGDCSVCDMIQTAINAGKVILGIIGSLVLLMFVYGGFTWLISGGNEGQIKKGKDILVNAVIGLAIVFSAYLIVTTLVTVLTKPAGSDKEAFNWEAQLTCAPVTFAPQTITDAANLSAAVPKGSNQKEGESCSESANCGGCTSPKCYCQKPADATTKEGKCVKTSPIGQQCKDNEISGNKSLTCDSGNCMGTVCLAPKEGKTCKNSGECSGSTYCSKAKICEPKIASGSTFGCRGMEIDNNHHLACADNYCTWFIFTAECGIGECCATRPAGFANGSTCDDRKECQSDICWEYADGIDDNRGECISALEIDQKCEDANVDRWGWDDDIKCPPGLECIDVPGLGSISTCQPKP